MKLKRIFFLNIVILSIFLVFPSLAANDFFGKKMKIPFEPNVTIKENKVKIPQKTELLVNFKVDKGSYLYKDQLKVSIKEIVGLKVGKPIFPKPKTKFDQFLNKNAEIYDNSFVIKVPLDITNSAKTGKYNISSTVGFQGCSTTICFLPQNKEFTTEIHFIKKK